MNETTYSVIIRQAAQFSAPILIAMRVFQFIAANLH